MPLSVLMSDTASAPASSAAAATAAGSAALGVSLTTIGSSVSGRTRSTARAVSPGSAPITSPLSTFGHDTFSSSIATSGPLPHARHQPASSSRLKPITDTTSGTGSSARRGRSCPGSPSRPLFGSPIELIIPAGVSHRRGGGLPWRGSSVIVFDTNAWNGKRSRSASPKARRAAIASNVPEPFRTGPVQPHPGKVDGARGHPQCPAPGTSAVSSRSASSTGPSTHRRR